MHAVASCGVSSSLAKIADAEWSRCCESVRKSSTQIGGLGQWRSLCDGGWMGKVPDDLPDTNVPVGTDPSCAALPVVEEELNSDTDLVSSRTGLAITSRDRPHSNSLPGHPSPTADFDLSQRDLVTVNSDIPALDHFPVPPVHFPLPHLQRGLTSSLDESLGNLPSYGRQTLPALRKQEFPDSTPTTPTEPAVTAITQALSPTMDKRVDISAHLSASSRPNPYQTPAPADLPTIVLDSDNMDFGIRQPHSSPSGVPGSSSLPKGSPRGSGVVLAMRNRFAQNVSYDWRVGTAQKLSFVVCLFSPIERSYNFDPAITGQCANHRQSLSTWR